MFTLRVTDGIKSVGVMTQEMMSFEQEIRSAEGYFELGMFEDALAVISSLPEVYRRTPPLLSIAGHCQLALKQWKPALETFRQLTAVAPLNPDGYLHAAFCLHELGRTSEAKETLLSASTILKGTPLFYYNLACYECRLGHLNDAKELLQQAISMESRFQTSWLHDPDLAQLRDKLL